MNRRLHMGCGESLHSRWPAWLTPSGADAKAGLAPCTMPGGDGRRVTPAVPVLSDRVCQGEEAAIAVAMIRTIRHST